MSGSCSIADAARALNMSQSTARRRIDDGTLLAAEPGRVQTQSVRAARKSLAVSLGMHEDGDCVPRSEHEAALEKIEELRTVIVHLRAAVAHFSDSIGVLESPTVPNN
jgi:hypothetical protein